MLERNKHNGFSTVIFKTCYRGREKRPQHDKEGFGARKRDKSFFV